MQELPAYRGQTALIVTTDHGRGSGGDWTRHGSKVPGSEAIWLAALGPDTPALGVRAGVDGVQAQVAATVAALLGRDWRTRVPAAMYACAVPFICLGVQTRQGRSVLT